MKIALVHYWIRSIRGGEKVLLSLTRIFPKAHIFTLLFEQNLKYKFPNSISTSYLNRFPFIKNIYTYLLPLFPRAVEQFDLREFDVVVSSESGPAKGVLTKPETCHICYCHSPMRYVWNMYHEYYQSANIIKKIFMFFFVHNTRQWDILTAARVDYFIANSENVRKRIRKYYRRDAVVIHPPVDTAQFFISATEDDKDYYFVLSELIPYKKIDLIVKVFNKNKKHLVIGGAGSQEKYLKRLANANITFLGSVSDEDLPNFYSRAKAFIFPQEEDFGITPLEAMASGIPVIAYGKGGALETVIDRKTGLFFYDQTENDLSLAIEKFEQSQKTFNSAYIRNHAKRFDVSVFEKKLKNTIKQFYHEYQKQIPINDVN